jgi:hypothetical protein
MNNSKILIERLERLSNKKGVLCEGDEGNSSIFKPLKINERLEPKRKELIDKGIIVINESTKVLTYKGNMRYTEYLILCTFYKDYIVNVKGNVLLSNDNLSSIDIQFNNVSGYFDCNWNNLTSLKNCPINIGGYFNCSINNLTSLEYCPKVVSGEFYCYNNSKQFTKEEILNVCKVKSEIIFNLHR